MIRGFVYSFVAIALFLMGSIFWLASNGAFEEGFPLAAGWVLLVCMFGVGPGFFFLGYWHSLKLNPDKPHWDPELGE
jgi:FtsH-binding integral membrane protein